MWSTRTNSVQELAEAVNRRFTNGTPTSYVVSILGEYDIILIPSASEARVGATPSALYSGPEGWVEIHTTEPPFADAPPGKFIGARYTIYLK